METVANKGSRKPKEGGEEGASEQDFEDWHRLWEREKHQRQSHCTLGFLLFLHLLTYSQRDSAVSVKLTTLLCGPQPLVWVLQALLHLCFSFSLQPLTLAPGLQKPPVIGVQVLAQ